MLDEEQTGLTQPPQQQSAVPEEQPEPSLESAASVESTASIPTESVPTAAAEQSAESEQPAAEAYPSFSEEADSFRHFPRRNPAEGLAMACRSSHGSRFRNSLQALVPAHLPHRLAAFPAILCQRRCIGLRRSQGCQRTLENCVQC